MIRGLEFLNQNQQKLIETVEINSESVPAIKTQLTSFYHMLYKSAQKFGERPFLHEKDRQILTFNKLLFCVDYYSDYLKNNFDIKSGDKVGILILNSYEFCISVLALNKIGACAVLLPTKFKHTGINELTELVNLKLFLLDTKYYSTFNQEDYSFPITECDLTDIIEQDSNNIEKSQYHKFLSDNLTNNAFILFTSGTSGKHKSVALNNFNIIQAVLAYEISLDLGTNDKTVIATPLYYVTGLVALFGLFLKVGGQIFLCKKFNSHCVLKMIKENELSLIHASPAVFNMLYESGNGIIKLPSLRYFLCGSGPMPIAKIKQIKDWIPQIDFRTVYGLTETSSPLTIMDQDVSNSKFSGSSGRPIPNAEVRIVDDDNKELAPKEAGNIEVKGANVIQSYYGETHPELFSDNWLKTGDIGYLSEQGYIYLIDRKKDIINVGGEKVGTGYVENQIYASGFVREVAVTALHDEKLGEIVGAVIVPNSNELNLTIEKLVTRLKAEMAHYQIPKKIAFVEEIPKTENLKIDKKVIQKILNEKGKDA